MDGWDAELVTPSRTPWPHNRKHADDGHICPRANVVSQEEEHNNSQQTAPGMRRVGYLRGETAVLCTHCLRAAGFPFEYRASM